MGMFSMFRRLEKDKPINRHLKKTKNVVYGARAMNEQLPLFLRRQTEDYDVYSKTPKKSARKLERHLDRHYGGNYYYVKPALHPNTFKVMDVGNDNRRGTRDDYGVADYTKPNRKIRSVKRGGIRYARLSERRKDIRKSLSDKESSFRHNKDCNDLQKLKYKNRIQKIT